MGKSRFWLMKSLKSTLLHHVSSICAFRDMDRVTSISGPSATTEPGPITTIGGRIEQVESHCLLNDVTVNDTLWIPLVYKNSLTLKINHFEWKRIVQPLSGRVYVNLLEWIWEAKAVIFRSHSWKCEDRREGSSRFEIWEPLKPLGNPIWATSQSLQDSRCSWMLVPPFRWKFWQIPSNSHISNRQEVCKYR